MMKNKKKDQPESWSMSKVGREKGTYIIKMFDEEGEQWAECRGRNSLSPRTASDLLVCFRVFFAVLISLSLSIGLILSIVVAKLF